MYDSTGNHSYLQVQSAVSAMIFLKFLQYEEFLAYVTTEPSWLHRILDGLVIFHTVCQ